MVVHQMIFDHMFADEITIPTLWEQIYESKGMQTKINYLWVYKSMVMYNHIILLQLADVSKNSMFIGAQKLLVDNISDNTLWMLSKESKEEYLKMLTQECHFSKVLFRYAKWHLFCCLNNMV